MTGYQPGRIVLEDERDFLEHRQGSGNTVEIFDIQVGSERRKGRGRELIETLLKSLPNECYLVYAITRSCNLIAQEFYESVGFRVVAVLRDFYGTKSETGQDQADAIMYGYNLKRT